MWLITTIGFFSAVQKPGTDFLTIRARVPADLDNLREKYLPGLAKTQHGGGTDYPCRATVSHKEFAAALSRMVDDIQYSNFKSAVGKTGGHDRVSIYHEVWAKLQKLEDMPEPGAAPGRPRR